MKKAKPAAQLRAVKLPGGWGVDAKKLPAFHTALCLGLSLIHI